MTDSADEPTVVFRGGTVWTGTGRTHALAVRGGRVHALGDAALIGDRTAEIDLAGGFLMPAFGDGHAHPVLGGLERQGPPVAGLASVAEIVEAVRVYAEAHPDVPWIVGAGYDPTLAPDGVYDARWLDAAVPDRPVVLRAGDYHAVWCNSAALARAGVEDSTVEGIVRSPLGTLREWAACDLVLRLIPPGLTDLGAAVRHAYAAYAAAGVTWVQDAWVDLDSGFADAYLANPGLRVALALRADPDHWRDQLPLFRAERERVATDLVSGHTVKFFTDGVIETETAALLSPYAHSCGHGTPVWPRAELLAAAAAVDAAGFQLHLHAIGDAGVRLALDAVEHATAVNPPRDRRPVITHVQLVDPADVPRFRELGVIANLQPYWAQLDPAQTELTIPRLGPDRAAAQYPIRTLTATTRVSFGSDWPVDSLKPLEGVQVAMTRQTLSGDPPGGWVPAERVDGETALACYTAGTAYQAFAEHERGTLAVGRQADLALLSEDPTTAGRPADVAVLGTWLAGRRIWG
ncbi:amidohydrolase [Actinokineospora fastidiosa]|uniref:Amidohydrolase n=1 Tax=Actinokineospora fastidiosa TaxID=1816 RepID=A0A918GBB8_9PSEU|nr:amidohydrolase [Actinokineospora fastidiosa]GGS27533.1 amidohydrolase [Actinokineospora fastidiosa]